MRIFGIGVVVLAIFIVLDQKLKKKSYDFHNLYIWLLYTISYLTLIYKYRGSGFVMIPIILLFLNKSLYTPLDFSVNSIFTLITSRNKTGMVNMCKNLFINNTNFTHNLHNIPQENTIWLLNYPQKNWIEYYNQSLLPQNYIFVANQKFGRILKNYYPSDRIHTIDFSKKNNYQNLKNHIKHLLNQTNVCLYFDTKVNYKGLKKNTYQLQTPRLGIFNIAKELNVKITPIVMDHLYISNGLIPPQNYQIYVGKSRFINSQSDIEDTIAFFKKKLNLFLTNKFRDNPTPSVKS